MRHLGVAVCLLLVLATACSRLPVSDELTIEPDRGRDSVLVTVTTTFSLRGGNDRTRERIEAARAAAISGTDAWSIRFGRLSMPEEERVTWQKSRGALERVTRAARIPGDDLQHLLSDTNITVDVLHGEGWSELTFYPGAGGRATRDQIRHFDGELTGWSAAVARYFSAIDDVYSYLRVNPSRARYVFAALLNEKGADGAEPLVTEEELPLVEAVVAAMEEIGERMDASEGRAETFAEEADLMFNPFPARVVVRPPGEILSSEGFTAAKDGDLVIEPIDLFAAIAALEGRWISPDPLVALLRENPPPAEEVANLPRVSQKVVSSTEIAVAIREQLARPRTYTVRWRE